MNDWDNLMILRTPPATNFPASEFTQLTPPKLQLERAWAGGYPQPSTLPALTLILAGALRQIGYVYRLRALADFDPIITLVPCVHFSEIPTPSRSDFPSVILHDHENLEST
jgi:hypothetical protein